jgi:hypothetical protein
LNVALSEELFAHEIASQKKPGGRSRMCTTPLIQRMRLVLFLKTVRSVTQITVQPLALGYRVQGQVTLCWVHPSLKVW